MVRSTETDDPDALATSLSWQRAPAASDDVTPASDMLGDVDYTDEALRQRLSQVHVRIPRSLVILGSCMQIYINEYINTNVNK